MTIARDKLSPALKRQVGSITNTKFKKKSQYSAICTQHK